MTAPDSLRQGSSESFRLPEGNWINPHVCACKCMCGCAHVFTCDENLCDSSSEVLGVAMCGCIRGESVDWRFEEGN